MRLIVKVLLPILVLVLCVVAARTVIANRPEPQTRPQFKTTTSVDATRVKKSDYPVMLKTQGSVTAAREGSLVTQVAGAITSVSPAFVVGGEFRAGEVLLEIDPRDYEIAVTLAEATVAQSRAALAEEQARSDQAEADWRRLGRAGQPSDLTLRKPQLAAARASLEGSRAQLERAKLDLARSKITASYDGRIRAKHVDLGQYVNKGINVAEIYSTDKVEIRLPLNSQQLGFVDFDNSQTAVSLSANVGGAMQSWDAAIARTEGAIDADSRQLYTIAEVSNPYPLSSDRAPLMIGQFVQAKVTGKTLKDVFVIPRSALREDREVLIVDDLNTLQARDVNIVWKDAEVAVIDKGLEEGEVINLTALGSVTNGTRVRATIDGDPPASERPANAGNRGNNEARSNNVTSGGSGGGQGRLEQLQKRVEAGETLPAPVVERFRQRMAAGEPIPPWMQEYLAKLPQ